MVQALQQVSQRQGSATRGPADESNTTQQQQGGEGGEGLRDDEGDEDEALVGLDTGELIRAAEAAAHALLDAQDEAQQMAAGNFTASAAWPMAAYSEGGHFGEQELYGEQVVAGQKQGEQEQQVQVVAGHDAAAQQQHSLLMLQQQALQDQLQQQAGQLQQLQQLQRELQQHQARVCSSPAGIEPSFASQVGSAGQSPASSIARAAASAQVAFVPSGAWGLPVPVAAHGGELAVGQGLGDVDTRRSPSPTLGRAMSAPLAAGADTGVTLSKSSLGFSALNNLGRQSPPAYSSQLQGGSRAADKDEQQNQVLLDLLGVEESVCLSPEEAHGVATRWSPKSQQQQQQQQELGSGGAFSMSQRALFQSQQQDQQHAVQSLPRQYVPQQQQHQRQQPQHQDQEEQQQLTMEQDSSPTRTIPVEYPVDASGFPDPMTSSSQQGQAGSCSPVGGGGGSISVMSSCSSLGTVTRQLFHQDAAALVLGPSPRGPTLEDWGGASGRSKGSMSAEVLRSGRNLISTPRERVSRSTGKLEAEGSELSAAVAKLSKARSRSASPRGQVTRGVGSEGPHSGRGSGGQLEKGFSLELQASWCSDMVTPREAVEVEAHESDKGSAGSGDSVVPKLNLAAITGSDQQPQQLQQQQGTSGAVPSAARAEPLMSSIAVQTSNRSSTREGNVSRNLAGAAGTAGAAAAFILDASASSSTHSQQAANATASWQSYQALAAPAAATASPRGLEVAAAVVHGTPAAKAPVILNGKTPSRLEADNSFHSASSASISPRTHLAPAAARLGFSECLSARGAQSFPPATAGSARGLLAGSVAASSNSSTMLQTEALPAASPFSPRTSKATGGSSAATAATLALPRVSLTPDASRQLSPRTAAAAAAALLSGSQSPRAQAAASLIAAIVSQEVLGTEAAAAPASGGGGSNGCSPLIPACGVQSPRSLAPSAAVVSTAAAAAAASMLATGQPQSPRAASAAAAIAQVVTSQVLGVTLSKPQSAPASPWGAAAAPAPASRPHPLPFGSYDGASPSPAVVTAQTASVAFSPALAAAAAGGGRTVGLLGPSAGSPRSSSLPPAAAGTAGMMLSLSAGMGAAGQAGSGSSTPSASPRAKLAELQRRLVMMAVEKATLERQVQQGKQQAELLQQEVSVDTRDSCLLVCFSFSEQHWSKGLSMGSIYCGLLLFCLGGCSGGLLPEQVNEWYPEQMLMHEVAWGQTAGVMCYIVLVAVQ